MPAQRPDTRRDQWQITRSQSVSVAQIESHAAEPRFMHAAEFVVANTWIDHGDAAPGTAGTRQRIPCATVVGAVDVRLHNYRAREAKR